MQLSIPRPVFLTLSLLISIVVYLAALQGGPIWDDFYHLFRNEAITGELSYWRIFLDFAWPLSFAIEKLLYRLFGENYLLYHLVNLALHFFNSWLMLRLLEKLDLPFPRIIFLLFLLHPSNVITVGWMIQLKTILCFTFAIACAHFLLRSLEDKRFWPLAWLGFLLSVLCKSASLPLAPLMIFYAWKQKGKSALIWMVPFVLISAYSAHKILSSEFTTLGTIQHESKTYVPQEHMGKVNPPTPEEVKETTSGLENKPDAGINLRPSSMLLKTAYYYFWQVVLPLENYPIKGEAPPVGALEFLHIIFLIALLYLTYQSAQGWALIGGHLLLAPFMGLILAPYMNLTWVSEQHLYLALPFFLTFWGWAMTKIKLKYALSIAGVILLFFTVQTYRASKAYANEIEFYTQSLKADPLNLPVVYNLANAYIRKNDLQQAIQITGSIMEVSGTNPKIRESKYFSFIATLHGKLVKILLQ